MPDTKTLLTNEEIITGLALPSDILTALATEQGDTYVARSNEFISALVNKIVYSKVYRMQFSNPFASFESFPVEYGDTIENIFCELPRGYKFDKNAADPFTKVTPAVKSYYASINYEMQYCLTVQDSLLRRAVKSKYGLMNLIENLLAQLGTAKEVDEYQAIIRMLNNADLYAGGFETLDVSALATDTAKYKEITKKIVNTVNDFCLPCVDNNKAGVMQVSNKEDVILIIKQSLLDNINLEYLAGVYNLSKTELVKKIIPVRSFLVTKDTTAGGSTTAAAEGTDIDFVVVDRGAFDIHTALEDGTSIYNPKGKYTNHFANLWKLISFKYFYNARAFKVTYEAAAGQGQ